jgi:hypothetical protein
MVVEIGVLHVRCVQRSLDQGLLILAILIITTIIITELGMEFRVLHLLGKHSTTELHPHSAPLGLFYASGPCVHSPS